jgi:hypothetical protein
MVVAVPAMAAAAMPAVIVAVPGAGEGGRGGEAGGDEGGGGNECKQTHPDILLLMAAGYSPSVTIDTPFGAVCP